MVPSAASQRLAWKSVWPWLLWAVWGAWLAVSDVRSDDLQAAAFRLLIGAVVLGYARPKRWWLWSLALAAWVPAEPLIGRLLRTTPGFGYNLGAWLLPPLPALAGGFLGRVIARSVLERQKS